MNVGPRNTRRVLGAFAVALILAGCGGGDGDSARAPSAAASTDIDGTELAGVHVDVRRDPG